MIKKMKSVYKVFASVVLIVYFSTEAFCQQNYFCEIKGVQKELSSGLKIVFDFGENSVYSIWGLRGKQKIVNEKGEPIPFNSMVDAGNYLSSKGWRFVQAYCSFYNGNAITHWLFSKESESIEKAYEGIMTKEIYEKRQKEMK